jgi:hypothetical protein
MCLLTPSHLQGRRSAVAAVLVSLIMTADT